MRLPLPRKAYDGVGPAAATHSCVLARPGAATRRRAPPPSDALSLNGRFSPTLVTFFLARFLLQDVGVLAC